jgi:hypothetical protein
MSGGGSAALAIMAETPASATAALVFTADVDDAAMTTLPNGNNEHVAVMFDPEPTDGNLQVHLSGSVWTEPLAFGRDPALAVTSDIRSIYRSCQGS